MKYQVVLSLVETDENGKVENVAVALLDEQETKENGLMSYELVKAELEDLDTY